MKSSARRTPALEALLKRQREKQVRQMGVALLAGTALLAAFVVFVPRPETFLAAEPAEEPAATQPAPDSYAGVSLIGEAAIVYDLSTGETLFARDSTTQLPLASLTKLLTIYAAADSMAATDTVTITDSALAAEGESGFLPGERFAFADLARLALVASSNDAAQAIAEAAEARRSLSGPNLLASAASSAGLSQTYALNGTGLDESLSVSGGYGSAKDVAILAGALLEKVPKIARASVEPSMTITSDVGVVHTLPNTNPYAAQVPNILLSKTGYTDLAGGNLVVVYDAGIDHPVAIVVLGSTVSGRFSDVRELLDRTHAHFAGVEYR